MTEPTAAPETPAPAPKRRNLNARQWSEAETLWASGNVTYDDLVTRYGCAMSTFERHFKKRGIVKGERAALLADKIKQQLEASAIDEATVTAARIRESKEQHYTMASNLAKLVWNEVLQAKKDGRQIATALPNLKAIDAAVTTLNKVLETRYKVLGLDRPDAIDPDALPELVISELTAEQVKALRDRDHSELDEIEASRKKVEANDDDEDGDAVVEED